MKQNCLTSPKVVVSIIESIGQLVLLDGKTIDQNWPKDWWKVYVECGKVCRETWANENDVNGQLHFVCGNGKMDPLEVEQVYKSLKMEGDRLYVSVLDGHRQFTIFKVLYDMKYCLDHFDFDYYIRPHTGSYVKLIDLQRKLVDCPRERFYSGCVSEDLGFVSGSLFVMSRDVVEFLVKDLGETIKLAKDYPLILDDVVIGGLLKDYASPDNRLCQRVMVGHDDISATDFVKDENLIQYHVNINNGGAGQIKLMKEIHKKLKA